MTVKRAEKQAMSEANDSDYRAREEQGERFLKRWSRRKQETAAARDPVAVDNTRQASPALTDADMPPIEALDGHSDYSMFLSPEVSDQLRRLALRKLFHSSEFNVRDGLDDYDQDFTQFTKLGDIITADLKHRLERELRGRGETPAGEPAECAVSADSGERAPRERPPADQEAAVPEEPAERLSDDDSQA